MRTTTDRPIRMGMMPPHPGAFIRTEILQPLDLSVTDAAKALRVSRVALSSLLNGQADLSGDMALRIEKAFGLRMETLMRMQSSYDMVKTRQRAKSITVDRRTPFADLPEFLSPEEFRAVVGIGRTAMYDLLRRGEIPHRKFGRCIRIPKTALHA